MTSKPNCSLTGEERVGLFVLLAIIPLIIAFAFAFAGVWIVLPFAGLELSALAYAFYYVHCHTGDFERITIERGCIIVEKCNNRRISQYVLSSYWAKVVQNISGNATRLWLQSHGQLVEVGCYMNQDERMHLAQQLRLRTGANEGNYGTR